MHVVISTYLILGVKGCITDADTGKPIPRAKLYIVGRKVAMFKSSKKGEYWRMLMPGNFEIMVRTQFAKRGCR